jgi:hypothetical protein
LKSQTRLIHPKGEHWVRLEKEMQINKQKIEMGHAYQNAREIFTITM